MKDQGNNDRWQSRLVRMKTSNVALRRRHRLECRPYHRTSIIPVLAMFALLASAKGSEPVIFGPPQFLNTNATEDITHDYLPRVALR
jgi:hypothetical protein